ncbi:M15 family metallopeptidase [Rhodoplanes sp. TEM]|uniref:D-alanyl-D-alanine dipeptidase n=1 Tax=Rhodoplanes tepidamans TaxID=200616 RepID=A0ABT5J8R9_RHOTP|nr:MULTISPECIES: M15 family metallopeptidase [Rhodoplanes]MDC7785993.1 M15 family metallopeptidase [Rhodoplanes tepidamans]MDC7984911.1 M15 family metallopeptidase [Rhodoplanes sp. TEM]MDQ0357040.1 D-alanyl-D-alanine dipeptidase [Rhodoplanes tepidamans]
MKRKATRLTATAALGLAIVWSGGAPAAAAEPLPGGLVRLREVAPDILQDMRYAGPFNFTGAPVPGYRAAECILWRPAAQALARAQARLAAEGYRLKVWDCYRPVRAVKAFAEWAKAPGRDEMKPVFYPALEKSRLFALGYIATRSKHSLGIAVDLGLVRLDDPPLPTPAGGGACDGPFEGRARESSLDLGTAFDCFSDTSATARRDIPPAARANRDRLLRALVREGFTNYDQEWWHFEYHAPGAPTEPFDVPVE